MRKVIYLGSVLFLFSCGGAEKPVNDKSNNNEHIEIKEEIKEEKVTEEVVEEPIINKFEGDITLGETLFTDKGCVACHQVSEKIVGPSLITISEGYGEEGDKIVSFLKEEGEAIIDPDQYEIMKANFAVTKEMSDNELKALAAYILKH